MVIRLHKLVRWTEETYKLQWKLWLRALVEEWDMWESQALCHKLGLMTKFNE